MTHLGRESRASTGVIYTADLLAATGLIKELWQVFLLGLLGVLVTWVVVVIDLYEVFVLMSTCGQGSCLVIWVILLLLLLLLQCLLLKLLRI